MKQKFIVHLNSIGTRWASYAGGKIQGRGFHSAVLLSSQIRCTYAVFAGNHHLIDISKIPQRIRTVQGPFVSTEYVPSYCPDFWVTILYPK